MNRAFQLFFFMFWLFPQVNLASEVLRVGVTHTVSVTRPEVVSKIKQALEATGLEFRYEVFPDKRSLNEFAAGRVQLDIYRYIPTMEPFEQLARIEVPVDVLDFWWWTGDPSLCELPIEKRYEKMVVGVLGANIFPLEVYPKFQAHMTASKAEDVYKILMAKRADFTIWSELGMHKIDPQRKMTRCQGEPFMQLAFYTYIHSDFLKFQGVITEAFQRVFKKNKTLLPL